MKRVLCFIIFLLILFVPCMLVSAEEVEDGTYIITSALSSNSVIDLSGGKVKNSNNIQIYSENGSNAQIWKIKKRSDGYYNIFLNNTEYVLDISGGKIKNSTNVQLYINNNTNAQKWKFIEDENGLYTIISYDNNYVLDISGGKYYNGTNIQIYKRNNTNAQKFILNKYNRSSKTIEEGIYEISSFDENYVLDLTNGLNESGNNVQIYHRENNINQRWVVKYIDGYYQIFPYISPEKSLDVENASKRKGANLQIYTSNNTDAQKWVIKDYGDGYFKLASKRSGNVLDIENSDFQDKSNVYLNIEKNVDSQKFQLNKIVDYGYQNIKDGYYYIQTRLNNNKFLDITYGKIVEEQNVQLYELNSTIAQKWHIRYLDKGYYEISNAKVDNFALTSGSLTSSNVSINTFNNGENQKWIIKDLNNGYYSILNNNFNAIDVTYGNSSNGTNIQIYSDNNSLAQQFKFIPTTEYVSDKVLENGYYFIESALNEDMVVDLKSNNSSNGSNIQLYSKNSTKAQKWYLTYISNGYYKITLSYNQSKSLDVSSASTFEGANVQLYQSNNSLAQQWIIKQAEDGYFYIISNCNGLYLDIDDGNIANESNIEMNNFTGEMSQKFQFQKTRLENLVLDISEYQKNIDWNQVKNKGGIYGVILRIGYLNIEDSKFRDYIAEVKRLNIPYGIYLFSYATDMGDVNKEVNFTKNMIKKYDLNPILGIYYDIEDWGPTYDGYHSNMNDKNEYDQFITSYVNQVKSVYSKYEVGVYTNLRFARNRFNDLGRSYVRWIAQWNDVCTYEGYYKMWQYSSKGRIPGISTDVDLNNYYFD